MRICRLWLIGAGIVLASCVGGKLDLTQRMGTGDAGAAASGVTDIYAGSNFTCAAADGSALCWGWNDEGELGDGTMTDRATPVRVRGLTSGVTAVAAGNRFTCALVNSGVQCWGSNHYDDAAANLSGYGTLGDGTTLDSGNPVQVQGLTSGVTAVCAGFAHACAIVNGAAQCWGDNSFGQLGDGTQTGSLLPVQVQGLTSDVSAISAGNWHTCAIVNGAAQCWGYNDDGELGNGTTTASSTPIQVQGLASGVTSISAGHWNSCAIMNGAALCWGSASYSQDPVGIHGGALGNGTTTDSSVPIQVQGLTSGVFSISAGAGFSCAIVDGHALCWGVNYYGALGNGTTTDSFVPTQVQGLTSGVSLITGGSFHTCAIVNGGAQCWGLNHYGELGNGTVVGVSSTPVEVIGL